MMNVLGQRDFARQSPAFLWFASGRGFDAFVDFCQDC
jgi:hypothetical protein